MEDAKDVEVADTLNLSLIGGTPRPRGSAKETPRPCAENPKPTSARHVLYLGLLRLETEKCTQRLYRI